MELIEPRCFDNVLPGEFCNNVIHRFDESPGKIVRKSEKYSFTELMMANSFMLDSFQISFIETANEYAQIYRAQNNIKFFPEDYGYEAVRIKRYDECDEFPWHVDVGDHESARRFLVCMFYLNDDFTGGETDFGDGENINYTIKPSQGSMLIFTPFWNNPHRGRMVTQGSKYIANVYFHYL